MRILILIFYQKLALRTSLLLLGTGLVVRLGCLPQKLLLTILTGLLAESTGRNMFDQRLSHKLLVAADVWTGHGELFAERVVDVHLVSLYRVIEAILALGQCERTSPDQVVQSLLQ